MRFLMIRDEEVHIVGFVERAESKGPRHGRQATMMEVQGSIAPHMMALTHVSVGAERERGGQQEGCRRTNERTNREENWELITRKVVGSSFVFLFEDHQVVQPYG